MSTKNQEFWMAKSQIKFYQDATEPKLYPEAFVKCAPIVDVKARDTQWSAVVNELRESMSFIHKKVGSCAYGQNDKWGCEMESVYRSSKYSLTKADQMMKEMGVRL
jgi:hypothetical protein